MGDWIVLSPTRWKLRRAIAAVNRTLAALQVEPHPDKTFIGRTARGFDLLGYHFQPRPRSAGTTVDLQAAQATLERFNARVTRLYEQGADEGRIGDYARRQEHRA